MSRFSLIIALLLCSFASVAGAAPAEKAEADVESKHFYDYSELASFPLELDGAFAGQADGVLVVAGGRLGDGSPNLDVYTITPGDESFKGQDWTKIGTLEAPLLDGAAISDYSGDGGVRKDEPGLYCVGGLVDGKPSARVTKLVVSGGKVDTFDLPELPKPLVNAVGVKKENTLFVAGADAEGESLFLSLDINEEGAAWATLTAWPGPARTNAAMTLLEGKIYLFGGQDPATGQWLSGGAVFDPGRDWKELASAPVPLEGAYAVSCGVAHVLFFGVASEPADVLAYHMVTDAWVVNGRLKAPVEPLGVSGTGIKFNIIAYEGGVAGEASTRSTKYGWLDWAVVFAYMFGMLLIGAYLAKREKSGADFFRGGQRVPWWASGLSLFATGASAISLMAMPGKSFAGDWIYFSISIYAVIVLPISMFILAPIARRLNVSTSNEYLERRFNTGVRLFGAIIYSLNQMLGRMAAIMLLPAIAINSITGLDMTVSILIMGIVTTIYVTMGGLEAVIWTDVVQAVVMVGSVLVCLIFAGVGIHMGFGEAWDMLIDSGKLHMADWDLDMTRTVVYVLFANTLVGTIGGLSDQNYIQRVQCTPSEKEAQKAVAMQIAVAVPLNVVLFSLGTVLYLFYRTRVGDLNPALKFDGIFPLFAAQQLPPGMAGLVVAALLAATMSTLSAAVHSTSNLGVEDFYRRFTAGVTDHDCVKLGRILTVSLGIIGTGLALWLATAKSSSIWDLAILITGMISAPIVGIFNLGVFSKRANTFGVICGSIACIAFTLYMKYGSDYHINDFLYLPAGFVVCYVVGWVTSFFAPTPPEKIDGLTAYTLIGKKAAQKRAEAAAAVEGE